MRWKCANGVISALQHRQFLFARWSFGNDTFERLRLKEEKCVLKRILNFEIASRLGFFLHIRHRLKLSCFAETYYILPAVTHIYLGPYPSAPPINRNTEKAPKVNQNCKTLEISKEED